MTHATKLLRKCLLTFSIVMLGMACGKKKLDLRQDKDSTDQADSSGFAVGEVSATPIPAPKMVNGRLEFSGKNSGKDCRRWAIRVTSPAKLLKLEAERQEPSDGDIAYEGNQNTFTSYFTTKRGFDVIKFQTTEGTSVTLSGTSTPCGKTASDDSFEKALPATKGDGSINNDKRTIQYTFK